jgi:flagellar M-ring protein FliF
MIKIGAMVAVVVILLLLAWRAARRNKKRTKLTAEELAHLEEMQAALEMQRLAELNAEIPQAALEAANREDEARVERQREIEQMVQEQPDEVALLLRGWLATK